MTWEPIFAEKDGRRLFAAAEYLTHVAAAGSDVRSFEMRYENENV